ncbi:MAG: hypothetical protein C0410_13430 [Anaerolinea sp.]|nr:hypothetical protein [Anaerolinea sp.]
MKKLPLFLCLIILLAACERPATLTNWSPINDVSAPGLTTTPSAIYATEKVVSTKTTPTVPVETQEIPTPWPTLDLGKFPNPLPGSMKGFELVSWQVGDAWNFTLITGTNRSKTFEELLSPESTVSADGFVKITVSGVENIKKVLALLPANTEVFWSGMDLSGQVPEGTLYFTYPEKIVKDDLINFCAKNYVALEILVEPGK